MAIPPEETFFKLVEPYRGEIRLHCYRMLGSAHDTNDILQETFVRAWRARASLQDAAAIRPWLYRIATNACLDELKQRKHRPLPSYVEPLGDPSKDPVPSRPEDSWLEPCPDSWLGQAALDPVARYELRESIALAFVAALQCLSARQRAVLLLRDVLGMSAAETAETLGTTVSGIDSTLYRAREATRERAHSPEGAAREHYSSDFDDALLKRYVHAWESRDVVSFVALLQEDVVLNMPPSPTWLQGRHAIATFFANHAFAEKRALKFVFTGANAQPALGFYVGRDLMAIHVVRIASGQVVDMHHFMTPECFGLFELPMALE